MVDPSFASSHSGPWCHVTHPPNILWDGNKNVSPETRPTSHRLPVLLQGWLRNFFGLTDSHGVIVTELRGPGNTGVSESGVSANTENTELGSKKCLDCRRSSFLQHQLALSTTVRAQCPPREDRTPALVPAAAALSTVLHFVTITRPPSSSTDHFTPRQRAESAPSRRRMKAGDASVNNFSVCYAQRVAVLYVWGGGST